MKRGELDALLKGGGVEWELWKGGDEDCGHLGWDTGRGRIKVLILDPQWKGKASQSTEVE